MLFKCAHGSPMYAPYPLHIAVPAIMIGHLTTAGLAEALLSGGMVAYLQKVFLRTAANEGAMERSVAVPVRSESRLNWIGVALLILGTPLGLLTASTPWGEWDALEWRRHGVRPPVGVGMTHLFATWSAPFAH